MRQLATPVLVLLILGAGAAGAEAATVERVPETDPLGSPTGAYSLAFVAAAGEANDVELRVEAGAIVVRDAGAALQAKGCEQVDPSTARCGAASPIRVALGDGDDALRVVDPAQPDAERSSGIRIDAGAGADAVTGGPLGDLITDGGTGEADRYAGGGGADVLTYGARTQPVRLTVGTAGEDAIEDVERFVGGAGDDVLTGGAGTDQLFGGAGDDVVRGLAGDDQLGGDEGDDEVDGGAGDDSLNGDGSNAGAGADRLEGGPGDDLLDLGVYDDSTVSIGGPDYEESADETPDVARCGAGSDTVRWSERQDRARGCEAATLGGGYAFGRVLRRVSRSRLRIVASCEYSEFSACSEQTVVLTRPGKPGRRLSRPATIDDLAGEPVVLRLTRAGRRYLRRHRAVDLVADLGDDSLRLRVGR